MTKNFKYKIQAKLYLKWLNFYYPLKLKWRKNKLLNNYSQIYQGHDKRWYIMDGFVTKEMMSNIRYWRLSEFEYN